MEDVQLKDAVAACACRLSSAMGAHGSLETITTMEDMQLKNAVAACVCRLSAAIPPYMTCSDACKAMPYRHKLISLLKCDVHHALGE